MIASGQTQAGGEGWFDGGWGDYGGDGINQDQEKEEIDEYDEDQDNQNQSSQTGDNSVTIDKSDSDHQQMTWKNSMKFVGGVVLVVSGMWAFWSKRLKAYPNFIRYGITALFCIGGVGLLAWGNVERNSGGGGTEVVENFKGWMRSHSSRQKQQQQQQPRRENSRARILHPRKTRDRTKRHEVFQRADTRRNTGTRGIPVDQVADRTEDFSFGANPERFEGASRNGIGFNRNPHYQPEPQPNPLTKQMGIHNQEDMRKYMGTIRGETQPQWASQRKYPYMPMSAVKQTDTKVNDFERLFNVGGQPERYASGRGHHMQQPKDQMGGNQYLPSRTPDFETPISSREPEVHPWMQQHMDSQEQPHKLIPEPNSKERLSLDYKPSIQEQQRISEEFMKNRNRDLTSRNGVISNEEREKMRTMTPIKAISTDVKAGRRDREQGEMSQQPQIQNQPDMKFDQTDEMAGENLNMQGSTTSGSFEAMFNKNSSLPKSDVDPQLLS